MEDRGTRPTQPGRGPVGRGSPPDATWRRPSQGRQAGQVIVVVALGLVALLGAAGLGVDGARLLEERRAVQAAVDHAATAAAYASCAGGDPAVAGRAAATRNGYDDLDPDVVVAIEPASGAYRAVITSTIAATLARVVGLATFDVSVEAIASCSGGGAGPGAVFAGGDTCNTSGKYAFQVAGSGQRVSGGVHVNQDVSIGSAPNWWTDDGTDDPFTYVGSVVNLQSPVFHPTTSTSSNVFEQASPPPGYPQQVAPKSWPAGYAPSDVASRLAAYKTQAMSGLPGMHYVNGDLSSLSADGLYYVTGKVDVGSVSGDLQVTIVSERDIKLSASTWTLSPYQDDLLAFSALAKTGDKVCDEFTVALSGSGASWEGIIWAPGGLAELSGSSNATLDGSLIAWAVRMNGSDLRISYDASLFGGPTDVQLVR